MIALDQIDDPELLRKHVRLAILEREYFKQRAKELREELDRLKGLTPAEQLECTYSLCPVMT